MHCASNASFIDSGLMDGDYYCEEDQTTRGFNFSTIAEQFKPIDHKPQDLPLASRRVLFPGKDAVDLEIRKPVSGGRTFYCETTPSDLAGSLYDYISNQYSSLVTINEHKRTMKLSVVANYERLQCGVAFFIPEDSQTTVAMQWNRKAGDAVQFANVVGDFRQHLRDARCIRVREIETVDTSGFSNGFPDLLWDDVMTPNSSPFGGGFPTLDIDPCTKEDIEPLLEMATDDCESMREAAASFCRMVDSNVDADITAEVLEEKPEILLGFIAQPECVIPATALVEKLATRTTNIDWFAVARAVCERVSSELCVLGLRLLTRALQLISSTKRLSADNRTELLSMVTSVQSADQATNQHINEVRFSLRV